VSIPPGANQVDARGRWILPGLIDTNVHLSLYKEGKAVDRERLPETRVLSMAPAAPGTRSAARH
jgi:imidazolonepropionase-like amidohydrolase